MNEDKSPLEAALDVFVYGPLGLFITVTEEMPKLVEKGRLRLTSQLGMARMMGEMAAPHLQAEAEKLVRGVVERVSPPGPSGPGGAGSAAPGRPGGSGGATAPGPTPVPAPARPAASGSPAPASASGAAGPPGLAGTANPEAAAGPPTPAASGVGPAPSGTSNGSAARSTDSTHLAIPGYDTLSAMQVVQRLAGLSPDELEAVAAYEASHRGRKTILHRAEQLRSEPAG